MKRHSVITAAVLSAALLTGCSAQEESVSSQPEPTLEGTSAAEPTVQAPTEETSGEAPEQTDIPVTTAPEETTVPAETASQPENTESYIADWIYGTWSVVSVNGADYWSYADENDLDSEYQLVFDKDGCQVLTGTAGLTDTMTYAITDEGADIYKDNGYVWVALTYDQSSDMLYAVENGRAIVLKRGENPRQTAPQMDYIADWIYGTWSMVTVNGQDFWEYACANDISRECIFRFTAQNVRVYSGDELAGTYAYRITDEGAEIFNDDGTKDSIVYDPAADTLIASIDGITGVFARGENPRPAAGWICGTWSMKTIGDKDFWEYADEHGITGEYILRFTEQEVGVYSGDTLNGTFACLVTEDGVEIFNNDGTRSVFVYDPAADTLSFTEDGITGVFARGENPRPAAQ